MSGRGKTVINITILEVIETVQNKLNTSLTPINTLTVEIAKIKQDLKNLQQVNKVNNEINMFMQQNNTDILKNYYLLKRKCLFSSMLEENFEEFKSVTVSQNQEILDNHINEYVKTYESQKRNHRKIIGTEPIPCELFPPLTMCHLESELISRLVSFYNDIYLEKGVIFYSGKQNHTELNQVHVNSLIIKENFEMFSSVGCKSDLNANIIAQFLTENKEVVCYPGFKSHKEKHWFHIESELQEKKCIM
ncbi:523_t:CDS:2 [Entrophospora sp. SA101]|nr:523_t:CDS:2 [Entrophospora sp. SA101]CAJ0825238.1 3554_t:CDS:2 [Entrophospora sp. SA101]CAJ0827186.1 10023_t:CDS:2 [Entrophospora sp. SA101]